MVQRLPVIYLRGYAGPPGAIDKQVDDPFYGFNDGATHVRVDGDGDPRFYQFESPLLRLIEDEDYRVLVHGDQYASFDVRRVFSLIGTDAHDYGVVGKAIGPRSDGLVHIDNAYVRGSHRAFVHRAHSGRYGLVNSEEGYQNLRRFLFGTHQVRVGLLGVTLPDRGSERAPRSWQADVRVCIRGLPIVMHEQLAAHYCPVQLNHELEGHADSTDTPVPLFTVFLLDPAGARDSEPDEPLLRCRYTLTLRVFHLVEQHRAFFWGHHLEQVPDWEDTLIVDVGRRDHEPETALHAWAAWNSAVPGPIEDFDPITRDDRLFTPDGDGHFCEIPLPEVARPVLGEGARLCLTVSPRD